MITRYNVTLNDLFLRNNVGASTYSYYDSCWRQEECRLFLFPELQKHLEAGLQFEFAQNWGFARVIWRDQPVDNIISSVYNSFAWDSVIFPHLQSRNTIELRDRPYYIDEDYKTIRNRSLFEIREILGVSHSGKGKDSVMLPSKYSGRFYTLGEQNDKQS
jgi:hypothetical protein